MSCAHSLLLLLMRMWPLLLCDAPPGAWDRPATSPHSTLGSGAAGTVLRYWPKRGLEATQNPDIAAHYLSDDPNRTRDPNSRTCLAPRPGCVLRYLTREAKSKPKTGNIAAQYLSDKLDRTGDPAPPEDVCCDIEQNEPWRRPKIQISQHSARRRRHPYKNTPSRGEVKCAAILAE